MRTRPVEKLALAVGLAIALAAVGCEKRKDADASYTTRGHVDKVEGSGADLRVQIHHERIASFKDRDGNASAMDSMSMIFALGPGVDPSTFKTGGKVSLDFDVRWSKTPPLVITRAEALPDSTALELGGHDHQH